MQKMNQDKYTFRAARPVYVYLRSHRDLDDDDAARDAADAMFLDSRSGIPMPIDGAELMAPEGDYDTFADGLVLRLKTERTLSDLASCWRDHLDTFANWVIHDGKRDICEKDGFLGTAGPHLKALRRGSLPVTQAFLILHRPDERAPRDPDALASSITAQWKAEARTVFRFRNGRVFLVSPQATAATLWNAMRSKFPRMHRPPFYEMAFDDGDGKAGMVYFGEGSTWTSFDFEEAEESQTQLGIE